MCKAICGAGPATSHTQLVGYYELEDQHVPVMAHQRDGFKQIIDGALRGLPLATTQANLLAMAQAAKASGARVLLLGMQVPPNYGKVYAQQFADTFVQAAKTSKSSLVPFFLKGVADGPDAARMFQADRIHPIAEAHPQLLNNVWPELNKLLR